MSLRPKQREKLLKKYYKELSYYNKLREDGVDCWEEYYKVLWKIKMLIRYDWKV